MLIFPSRIKLLLIKLRRANVYLNFLWHFIQFLCHFKEFTAKLWKFLSLNFISLIFISLFLAIRESSNYKNYFYSVKFCPKNFKLRDEKKLFRERKFVFKRYRILDTTDNANASLALIARFSTFYLCFLRVDAAFMRSWCDSKVSRMFT